MRITKEQLAHIEAVSVALDEGRTVLHQCGTKVTNPITAYWLDRVLDMTIAPKMRSLNGHEYPEPMLVAPEVGTKYWIANPTYSGPSGLIWQGDLTDLRCLADGFLHATESAAQQHIDAQRKANRGEVA